MKTLLATIALCLAAPATTAQMGGTPPLRILIPLGTGTPSDFVTRIVATAMSDELKRPIVIDNRPGANGILAVQELQRAKPDGATLMLGGISPMALNVAVLKSLPYDPRRDFTPIGGMYNAFQAYVASGALPVKSFAEFMAYAKKNPGKVTVGHYSALSRIQFAALGKLGDVNMLMVPYKSTMPAVNDVLAGTIDATLCDIATALSFTRGGRLKAIAISLADRSPLAPGIPAASESVPGMAFPAWSGLVGPAGIPGDVAHRLNVALNTALGRKDVVASLAEQAVQVWPSTPEAFARHVDDEIVRWTKLARDAGIHPE